MRNDTQLPEGELQLDAAVFFVGQDRRALQGGTQGVAIDQHSLVRTNRDYRVVVRETAINQLAGERDVLAMDAQVVAAHLQFHAAVTTFKQALYFEHALAWHYHRSETHSSQPQYIM